MKKKLALSMGIVLALSLGSVFADTDATTGASMAEPVGGYAVEITGETYTVKAGDTMWMIAYAADLTTAELVGMNPQIVNPDLLEIGDVLNVGEMAEELPLVELVPATTTTSTQVDTMTAASENAYHYIDGTLSPEDLMLAMNASEGVNVIATTNADGSPSAATMIPYMLEVDGDYYIVYGAGSNATVTNLKERNYGMMEYYIYKPELLGDENKFTRNSGSRLIVEYVQESNEALDAATTGVYGAPYSASQAWMVLVKVLEFKPLG